MRHLTIQLTVRSNRVAFVFLNKEEVGLPKIDKLTDVNRPIVNRIVKEMPYFCIFSHLIIKSGDQKFQIQS